MKISHLLVVCVALGALVWIDNFGFDNPWNSPSTPSRRDEPGATSSPQTRGAPADEERAAPSASGAATGNPLASIDAAALSDTVDRPLFAPSRSRPPEVVAERAQAPPPPPPPSFALLGVVHDGGRAIALVRKVSDGTTFRVEVGDTIGGWQVAGVEATSIRLQRADGTSRTVHLRDDKPPAKPNAAPTDEAQP
ncbi:MAG: hypothetical protein Q8K85_00440 [Hyphomicrobium sp.]|nr:hypothetical protein [Hyphomicrobium sp.]